ncbi:MAG: 2-oxoglutarate dehydrogenase E1 component, partial [Gammaproteobacteria bacterium]|nr:2-oxoglutarate dehydrogenase E1 component [Gammaproteobacteria bacterium]
MSQSIRDRYLSSPLFGANAPYVEELFEAYRRDPASVPSNWQSFFAGMGATGSGPTAFTGFAPAAGPAVARRSIPARGGDLANEKQAAVARLIQIFSQRGYQVADLDPLGLDEPRVPQAMRLDYAGLGDADLDSEFYTTGLASTGGARMKLRDILALLQKVYSGKIGADYTHLQRSRERSWIRERLEQGQLGEPFSAEERRHILGQLTAAEGIERYLHTRYVGQKRFSLEGGETMVAAV